MPRDLDGNLLAAIISDEIKSEITRLKSHGYRAPYIYIIVAGADVSTVNHLNYKQQAFLSAGIECTVGHFLPDVKTEVLTAKVEKLNKDPEVDGILIQMPLPLHINPNVVAMIEPQKDVVRQVREVDLVTSIELARLGSNLQHVAMIGGSAAQWMAMRSLQSRWPHLRISQIDTAIVDENVLAAADLFLVNSNNKPLLDRSGMKSNALVFNADAQTMVSTDNHNAPIIIALQMKQILSTAVARQWSENSEVDRGLFPMFHRKEAQSSNTEQNQEQVGLRHNSSFTFDLS